MLSFDPSTANDLADAMAASPDQITQLSALRDALGDGSGAPRTLIVRHATSGDAWADGSVVYQATLSGAMNISAGRLSLGDVSAVATALPFDLTTGATAARVYSQSLERYAQGLVGLVGSGSDWVVSENLTADIYGLPFAASITADQSLAPAPDIKPYQIPASFKLRNWSGASSRTLARVGMPFRRGDIPVGMVPEIRRAGGTPVAAQFDERSTWSDGSLRFAVCHLRDDDIAAMSARDYDVFAVEGAYDNTSEIALSAVVAENDLQVELAGFAQWDGTTSTQRGAGAALATLTTHAATPTRVTKVHSGSACEGWVVWGMVKDGASGAGADDAHLKAIWHIDVWKDAGGAVIDTEYAVELAQDWWGVAGKCRLDYTATLKRNGVTIQAYAGIQHPYGGHWMTVRTQDDNNHARRHRAAVAWPTLTYEFNRDYWIASHLVPPYDTTIVPTAAAHTAYVPGGSMQHRAAIDGTGAYMGRGMLPACDARAFLLQGAADIRNSRTNAFAGLHVPFHFRDERTRTRPGDESDDVANTLVPMIWDPKPASASTFAGLPEPKHAYRKSGTSGGYQAILGGRGVWSTGTNDASHAVQYCAFAYLVEGERYFLDSMIDLAHYNAQDRNGNSIDGRPYIPWYDNVSAREEMSIPATRWAAIPDLAGQERSLGWSMNLLGYASALSPDDDPQGQYMKAWNAHCGEFLAEAASYTPPSLKAAGMTPHATLNTSGTVASPWMKAFNVQCCANNFLMTEVIGCRTYADMIVRGTMAIAARNRYDLTMYRWIKSPVVQGYSGGNYLSASKYLAGPASVTVSANVVAYGNSEDVVPPYKNGDLCYFFARSDSGATVALPVGYVEGTPLYVVETSGFTFRVALSAGGAPIAVPDGTYMIASEFTNRADIAVAVKPPYLPTPDSYAPIHEAAFAMAEIAGLSSVPPGTFAATRAFLINVARDTDPRWALAIKDAP